MNCNLVIALNSMILGVSLCLLSFGGKRTVFLLVAITVFMTIFNRARPSEWINLARVSKRVSIRFLWGLAVGFIVYFLLRQFFENLIATKTEIPLIRATTVFFQNACLAWQLFVVVLWGRRLLFPQILVLLLMAIGCCAGLNLLFDPVIPRPYPEFGTSRFEGLSRWMPPLVRSNANFAMLCTVCVGTSAYLLAHCKSYSLNGTIKVFVTLSMILAAAASFRCQFRAHLFTLAASMILLFVTNRILLRILLLFAFTTMVIFPTLFIGKAGENLIQLLPIEEVLGILGSKTDSATNLSGRTEIYQYGWKQLSGPAVFLVGEGPVLRDAQRGVWDDVPFIADYHLPYHSTFLDSLVQHGVLTGTAILLLLLFLGLKTTRATPGARWLEDQLRVPCVMFILWFTISIMDGGLSNFENLVFVILMGFGALSWSETCEYRRLFYRFMVSSHEIHAICKS